MIFEKNNKINTKAETEDYENRYRFYATVNPTSENIINLDIFYKHNPQSKESFIRLDMFNRFYKPFEKIDWNNTKKIEWLKDSKYDIEFLKERDDNCYHYRYYIDRGTYSIIEELQEIGFVPVVWKLPKYVEDIKQLQKEEQTEDVKKELSNCRRKLPMLYLAFTPYFVDENLLRFMGLAQINKYIMLHDLVYAVKKTGFTDLKQICNYLRKRQDMNKNRSDTGRNKLVIDHHTKIENSYNTGFSKRLFPYTEIDHLRYLYNHITAVWYIENLSMPSANNLMNNLYEIDSKLNSQIKNKIIDRNAYMFSYITDYKTQIITVYLQNFYTIPETKDTTNVIEIVFPISTDIGESTSKNIESLYEALEEARKEEKTEGDFLYQYAQKNGLDLRYRPYYKYNKDDYFLYWLNKVPLFVTTADIDNVVILKHI